MVKYLIKTVETYRIELSDVDLKDFEEQVREDAKQQGYNVVQFSWTERSSKEDEWYKVVVTKNFAPEKDPDLPLKTITYETYVHLNDVIDEMDIDEEEFEID